MNLMELKRITEQYPNWIPLKEAAPLLGVSPRQLTRLIADGREPFASLGADIGVNQHYCRIYTNRLVKYLSGGEVQEVYGNAD